MSLSPTAILSFYALYYDYINTPDEYFSFHGGTNGLNGAIVFGGITYQPVPVEIESVEQNSLNRISRPKIRISNVGNSISRLLKRKNDFKNGRIVRIKTFLKFIDDVNFDNGQNPYGLPDPNAEISRETFIINQKTAENKQLVEFELTYPFDLEAFDTPGRIILGRHCPFQYRGKCCNYFGPPVCKGDDSNFSTAPNDYDPFSSENLWTEGEIVEAGDVRHTENAKDPPRTVYVCKTNHTTSSLNHPATLNGSNYWEKDDCSRKFLGCQKRFVLDTLNPSYLGYLPFGGFPATDKYPYG